MDAIPGGFLCKFSGGEGCGGGEATAQSCEKVESQREIGGGFLSNYEQSYLFYNNVVAFVSILVTVD